MKRWMFSLFVILHGFTFAEEEIPYSIVFVHLGPQLPSYVKEALAQARLFNANCPIYLIANQRALQRFSFADKITTVAAETLPKDPVHEAYARKAKWNRTYRGDFWSFAIERFYYLYDLMKERKLSHVFHLENDVMLYADLEQRLPLFQEFYSDKIAATFDNDRRCIAGFVYIPSLDPLYPLLEFIAARVQQGGNDMTFLAEFKNETDRRYIDHLPILMPAYALDYSLTDQNGDTVHNPESYWNHFAAFGGIFDAAALGQYLGGIDPQHNRPGDGFINESTCFNVSHFFFDWTQDEQGRWIPWIHYRGQKWPIYNLHIHSKNLQRFLSKKRPL